MMADHQKRTANNNPFKPVILNRNWDDDQITPIKSQLPPRPYINPTKATLRNSEETIQQVKSVRNAQNTPTP